MTAWPSVELSAVAEVSSGDGAPQEDSAFSSFGTPFIRAGSLAPLTQGTSEGELELIPEEVAKRRRMRIYPPKTVVFAKSGMSCTKGLVHELRVNAHVVNHLAAIECGSNLDSRFLLRWFERNTPARLIANPAYPSIKISDIRSEKIPLPPLPDQKRIAKILDAADALRAKRRESLAQLDALLRSTFLDMFGDPVANPMGWSKAPLGELASKITDGEHLNPLFSETGMPMVMAGNVLEAGVDLESAKRIESELGAKFRKKCAPEEYDILLVSRGATIGRTCIIRTALEFCLMGSVILVKPLTEKLRSSYLSSFLRHPAIKAALYKTSGSSAQQAIYIKDIRKLACMVPTLDLQGRFTDIVESVEQQKARLHAHLAELDTLFASLQHRAFNGEL